MRETVLIKWQLNNQLFNKSAHCIEPEGREKEREKLKEEKGGEGKDGRESQIETEREMGEKGGGKES